MQITASLDIRLKNNNENIFLKTFRTFSNDCFRIALTRYIQSLFPLKHRGNDNLRAL